MHLVTHLEDCFYISEKISCYKVICRWSIPDALTFRILLSHGSYSLVKNSEQLEGSKSFFIISLEKIVDKNALMKRAVIVM